LTEGEQGTSSGESLRRRVARGSILGAGALVVVMLVVILGPGGGNGNPSDLHDLIGDGEITADTVTLDNYADVVRVVGEGDIPDDDKREVARALRLYLDGIGESVVRQTETDYPDVEAQEAEDFNRPDLVDYFQELGHDEEAARQVADSMIAWVTQLAQPFLTDADLEQSEVGTTLDPVAPVMGSIEDGFDAAGDAPVEGREFERIVIGQLREDFALAVAADRGWPTPEPGGFEATLARAFPDNDFLGRLDLDASNEQRDDEDAHW
jgi:hypothetical protein